jgi:predicted aconitase with swiveling domain
VERQVARRRIAGMAGNIITIRGRKVIAGVAEGEAIVSKGPVMGLNNFNPRLGIITERDHPLRGIPLTGKVFVFPTPRGSGGWVNFGRSVSYGTNPIAMIYYRGNALTVCGALVLNRPTVGDCEQDPSKLIDTGDWVRVDADKGIVEATKKDV